MTYSVKEIYYTLQGEGANTGQPAVFCRFSGCNLWSGRESDRGNAICQFCDTDFVGTNGVCGGSFESAEELAEAIDHQWESQNAGSKWVVCTGGEPLLQLDLQLIRALHQRDFSIAVETNGTRPAPEGIDWICVSPKAGAELVLRSGNELKLVFPQKDVDPTDFERLDFRYWFLQPMDGEAASDNTQKAINYCLQNPQWKLSLQTHKLMGIS